MSIIDPRLTKLARILVDHSLKVKPGERVAISSDFIGKPLVTELYRLLLKRGVGEVKLHFDSYELGEIYYQEANLKQIQTYPKISDYEIKNMDCWIGIRCQANTRGLSGIDPKKISKRAKVIRPITRWRVEKTRWVITNFPCEAMAQEADMSLADYENFVYSATNDVDWKKLFKAQEKLRRLIDKAKKVRIVAKGTDLTLSKKGRKAVNAGGEYNMPDGEVFTSVVEDSTEGVISFSFPAIHLGREFHDVTLEFKKGKVVKATASKGEGDLNKILDMDKGARTIGELGIGNNFMIKRFTKDGLFDEKIGGTIHIALGEGYKETLSKNKSSLHWDMICDLRQGGELWFDDKLVQKGGKWLK